MSRVTIVALGDSTTAGTPEFQSPLEAPPEGAGNVASQFAYWLMRTHEDWRVLNRGVNGERSDQIRARFARDVLAVRPHAVVIIAGVNDIYQGRTSASVCRELEAMYEAAVRRAAPAPPGSPAPPAPLPVIAGSILPFNSATPLQNRYMREVNAWIGWYAGTHPTVFYCDTRAAVAHPENPDLLASSSDGLHPSPEGYRRMAVALEPAIRRALVSAQRLL
jgi:lysophospholipase L1-like esterase